ncbi:hypothetical protein Tco_1233300, partial [Tanacetum coccineum]
MVVSEWHIRAYEDEIDEEQAYANDPKLMIQTFSQSRFIMVAILLIHQTDNTRKGLSTTLIWDRGTGIGKGSDSDEEEDNIDSDIGQGSEEDNIDSDEDDSDEEDSDYIDDEDHMMNEVEVDMKEYLENIDKEVEWVGPSNENVYENEVENFEHGINLDDFESASDSENDGKRKKALRKLRREHEANRSGDTDSSDAFYVGRQFTDKKSIKEMVYSVSVATRRQLYIWKNDKHRVRVVCRGKTPVFTYPTVNGPNGSSPSKLKNIGGKWVKEKGASGSSSVVNKESGMMIKVGRKN